MKFKFGVVLSVAAAMFVASGCADNYSGNTYQSNRAGIVQNVSYGTVTNIRQVNIQDDSSNMPIGAVAGAVVGGLLGHSVGGGAGKKLATVGGVVAGGLAGNAIQNQTGKTTGMEVEIRLDNGQTIAVVQKMDPNFQIGSRVRLVDAGGRTTASLVSNVNSGYAAPVVQQGYAPVQ
jgi:outer membrane lipoprotein SlyB